MAQLGLIMMMIRFLILKQLKLQETNKDIEEKDFRNTIEEPIVRFI